MVLSGLFLCPLENHLSICCVGANPGSRCLHPKTAVGVFPHRFECRCPRHQSHPSPSCWRAESRDSPPPRLGNRAVPVPVPPKQQKTAADSSRHLCRFKTDSVFRPRNENSFFRSLRPYSAKLGTTSSSKCFIVLSKSAPIKCRSSAT